MAAEYDYQPKPIPYCLTTFTIVPAKRGGDGLPGFIARWSHTSTRAVVRDACDWRMSREAVRHSMANLYADIQEGKS